MKKKSFDLLFKLCFIAAFTTFFAATCFASSIRISLNGSILKSNVAPVQTAGTTLVPIRVISENLGASVNYDSNRKLISITTDTTSIELIINQKTAKVNQKNITLNVAPQIINNTTMVPIRFVSENLNCSVSWDAHNQLVTIISKSPSTTHVTSSTQVKELPTATIKVKDYGTITIELYPELAPNTVKNFIALANSGFYNNLTFHRVIKDFMIQGGDPLGNGSGGPDYSIAGEFAANGFTTNTLSHTKGVLSMARTYNPDSAGSQFFITSADVTYLDGQYAAFGKVTNGMNVVEAISNVSTDSLDAPLKTITIESIKVDTHGINYSAPTKLAN